MLFNVPNLLVHLHFRLLLPLTSCALRFMSEPMVNYVVFACFHSAREN